MKLKSNSICALPDGRELIVRQGNRGVYFLHDPRCGVSAAPIYLIDASGQLLSWGRPTRWTLADLRDTGKVSEPELQRVRIL